jgi:hypothetical protein
MRFLTNVAGNKPMGGQQPVVLPEAMYFLPDDLTGLFFG